MTFRFSPSGLSKYYTCPAQYDFSRKLKPIETSEWLEFGLQAHAMMEGEDVEDPHFLAVKFYKELRKLKAAADYEVIAQELYQTVPFRGMEIDRRIDAIVRTPSGKVVLVDWKTAGKEWEYYVKNGLEIAPKGAGFQAASYLVPPEDHEFDFPWPDEIHFVVAPASGKGRIFVYHRDPEDEDNLYNAAEWLRKYEKNGIMIKNRGFVCKFCDWSSVCYELPGWEQEYELKEVPSGD